MRQGQQHRRGRGRHNQNNGNQHRKGQNPLTRSFESNGPDVKVRGTPAHIAEKYISLARDAQSSGDPVLAENYLQHAEHYNRIILAFREQQMQHGDSMNGGGGHPRGRPSDTSEGDDFSDDDGGGVDDIGSSEQPTITRFPHEMQQMQPSGEQQSPRQGEQGQRPRHEQQGRFRDRFDRHDRRGEHQDRGDRSDRGDRGERSFDRPERQDRQERQDRFGDRQQRFSERRDRHQQDRPVEQTAPYERTPELRDSPPPIAVQHPVRERAPEEPVVADAPPPAPRGEAPSGAPRRRERFGLGNDQPEFLRRPVRRPRREPEASPAPESSVPDEPTRE
jgi:hypothetical protein